MLEPHMVLEAGRLKMRFQGELEVGALRMRNRRAGWRSTAHLKVGMVGQENAKLSECFRIEP
jgi:hypothetical protein